MKTCMNKVTLLVIALILALSFTACANKEGSGQVNNGENDQVNNGESGQVNKEENDQVNKVNLPGAVPKHPYMADSVISKTHADAYSTGAFTNAGPIGPDKVLTEEDYDFYLTRMYQISMQYSTPYPDGRQVMWASNQDRITKLEVTDDGINEIDVMYSTDLPEEYQNVNMKKPLSNQALTGYYSRYEGKYNEELEELVYGAIPKSNWTDQKYLGIYSVLDNEGSFYVAYDKTVVVFEDEVKGNPDSPIKVKAQYNLDLEKINSKSTIVGVTITWDGYLAILTTRGEVVVVSRDFDEEHYVTIEDGGFIRNSITVDEDGGIYVATDKKMVRVQWTGEELTTDESAGAWESEYEYSFDDNMEFWGSGATPALIGTGDDDKFVVITDGAKVNNIVYLWRDEIPEDWEQIPGTESRRIAAQVPCDFGNPDIERSYSEQSVLVNGYDSLVVNNVFVDKRTGESSIVSTHTGLLTNRVDFLELPYGIQKFHWDPETRKLESSWVNNEVSSPTNVPSMSVESNMVYINSPDDGNWTLAGIDWTTGETSFRYILPGDSLKFNAMFTEVQVLPNGDIIHGTFNGILRIKNQGN